MDLKMKIENESGNWKENIPKEPKPKSKIDQDSMNVHIR